MPNKIAKWIREHYNKIINSIAFYPALMCLGFVLLSWIMLQLDFSETGKQVKGTYNWLRLQDADTARNITATVAAGILSLTVFSFSMVMIVMNQAASSMSNRLLESLIGNRLQQAVLGFYIGTIVYALFLLSAIRDIDSGIHIPALSVYLLILITIIDIFLFISFLHYVTQSVLHENIISRIRRRTLRTMEAMQKNCKHEAYAPEAEFLEFDQEVKMPEAGYYQGLNLEAMLTLAEHYNLRIRMLHTAGTYLLKNTPLLQVKAIKPLSEETIQEIHQCLDIFRGEPIERNYYYGFRHLTEVAVKALSPGINDPSTAVHSLQALCALLDWRITNPVPQVFGNAKNEPRIFNRELNIDELVAQFIFPVWDYGKKDRYVKETLLHLLPQMLQQAGPDQSSALLRLLHEVKAALPG